MSDQSQIKSDVPPARLGRRQDPAEARVNQRLASDPSLTALHDGTLDHLPDLSERGSTALPEDVNSALSSSGRPLDDGVRHQMEGAFGESFADVRLHTDARADKAAAAMDSTAFASGSDIGFAAGAYQPDTAIGRGIIAHELGHVSEMRRGDDHSDVVRGIGEYAPGGVGFFQQIARAFGGGSFSPQELTLFINAMSSDSYVAADRDYADTDNMARDIARRVFSSEATAETRAELPPSVTSVRVRLNMLRHLLTGHVAGSDSEAAIQILRYGNDIERRQIVTLYGEQQILHDLHRNEAQELARLLGIGVPQTEAQRDASQSMPVRWEMNTTINNAPGLNSLVRGIGVESFNIRPQGEDRFRTLRRNALFEGDNARNQVITEGALHPRNENGLANMTFWVVPQNRGEEDAYAFSTRTALPDHGYPVVNAATNQKVEASLEVDLGAATIGEVERGRGNTVSRQRTDGGSNTQTNAQNQQNTNAVEVQDNLNVTDTESDTLELSRGRTRGSVRGIELERSWNASVAQTREDMVELETSLGQSTTNTTSTEVEIGGSIGAEAMAALRAQLGISGEGSVGLEGIGTGMLSSVLTRLPAAPARALGAILSMVDGASAGLNLGLSGEAGAEGQLTISGTLNGRAARLWSEARTRNFNITRRESGTDTSSAELGVGGAERASGEESAGASEDVRRARANERAVQQGRSNTVRSEQVRGETNSVSSTQSFEEAFGAEASSTFTVRRNLLVPVVQRQRLTFRVDRDPYGESAPLTEQPQPRAASGGNQAREEER